MPEPLDYFNPMKREEPEPSGTTRNEERAQAPVPVEFDVLLTESSEHAAVRAIVNALQRAKIAHHLAASGDDLAARVLRLYVRSADRERAAEMAGRIFATRKKLKSFPRPQMPAQRESWPHPMVFGSFLP
jgi:hypothetical protein